MRVQVLFREFEFRGQVSRSSFEFEFGFEFGFEFEFRVSRFEFGSDFKFRVLVRVRVRVHVRVRVRVRLRLRLRLRAHEHNNTSLPFGGLSSATWFSVASDPLMLATLGHGKVVLLRGIGFVVSDTIAEILAGWAGCLVGRCSWFRYSHRFWYGAWFLWKCLFQLLNLLSFFSVFWLAFAKHVTFWK